MDFSKFFKTMSKQSITTLLITADKGADCEVAYFSECKPSAVSKKNGMHLYKLTTVQCKLGLDYATLPEVVERHNEPDYKERKDNFEPMVNGKLYFNNGKIYVSLFYPTDPVSFFVVENEGTGESYMTTNLTEEEKAITIPSYWTKRDNPLANVYRRINTDNILSIRIK